jgi:orotate phosphoribosyltransferase
MTKDENLAADINAIALVTGTFRLRSGAMATEYFDKYLFESDPNLLRRIARAMVDFIPAETQILAGLELGGVPLATAMSLICGLPVVFVRKAAKDYGTCQVIEGRTVNCQSVLIVEDVISTGGMVIQSAQILRGAGAIITGVVCAIWRPASQPHLEGLNAPIFPALTKAELSQISPKNPT